MPTIAKLSSLVFSYSLHFLHQFLCFAIALQACFRRINESCKVIGTSNHFREIQGLVDICNCPSDWSCGRCPSLSRPTSSTPLVLSHLLTPSLVDHTLALVQVSAEKNILRLAICFTDTCNHQTIAETTTQCHNIFKE